MGTVQSEEEVGEPQRTSRGSKYIKYRIEPSFGKVRTSLHRTLFSSKAAPHGEWPFLFSTPHPLFKFLSSLWLREESGPCRVTFAAVVRALRPIPSRGNGSVIGDKSLLSGILHGTPPTGFTT